MATTSGYKHGVYIKEQATGLVTPATAESALPVIVGTAPVHNLENGPVNVPVLLHTLDEYFAVFGETKGSEKDSDYTLTQAAKIYMGRYKVEPVVMINVYDPVKHEGGVADVSEEDIIGGVSEGVRTGLALVEEVFPRFRLNPGMVLAPKFSADPSVALAIAAACKDICGHFRALGLIDIPDSVAKYSDAPAWLNDNNLTSTYLCAFFGSGVYNGELEPGSIHLAGCMGCRDAENGSVPFWSPSNYTLACEGLSHAGKELHLTASEAAYLNGQGIVTGLNMIGGLKCWGDQTTAYPGNTDVKDSSIPIRRMFDWIGNTLVKTCWQFVSAPARRRLVETVQDTFNIWLNGLTAKEYILGGRVEFLRKENSTLDLMDGKLTWHVYVTPPQAARELNFTLEYDPAYLETLFG